MNKNYTKGISVIVCCYNSSGRIEQTLLALVSQQCYPHTLWEIIIVDNNSTDNTSEITAGIWGNLNSNIEFKIITEPLPGLLNARKKGISEAAYPALLFCDDDNWLASNYVQGVLDILDSDSKIAACGGMGIPVFESEEPHWFYAYAEAFALGSQEINSENGRILNLYGAGLAIRKQVIEQLFRSGFSPILQGRTGKQLSSSEDTELTYSFVLMGYELACSDELKFFHYLPKERLTFNYLKNLFIAFGADGPVRNLYYANISDRIFHRYITNWNFHFFLSVFRLVKYFIIPPKKFGRSIYYNWSKAYIKQLFSIRKKYSDIKNQIEEIKTFNNYDALISVPKNTNFLLKEAKDAGLL